MQRMNIVRGIGVIAVAGLSTALLAGCFPNPLDMIGGESGEGSIPSGADELIEGMTGGEMDIEFGSMPEDFPAEVPVVSDNVIQSTSMSGDDGSGMMVVVSDPRSFDELVEQVRGDFSKWEQITFTELGEIVNATYTFDETLSVNVGVAEGAEGEDTTVSYMVLFGE